MQEQVDRWSEFWDKFVEGVMDWTPKLIGALIILVIGYFVAKVIAGLVRRALHGIKLDQRLHSGNGGNIIQRAFPRPSNLIASIAFWVIFIGAISLAVGALGVTLLTDLVRSFYSYVPNIIAALLIFLIASAISAGIAELITNIMGKTPTGKVIAGAAPALVMGLAIFMILNQLRIAPEIVTITYAALVGGASLGAALAFGLGGREMAARIWESAYQKSQEQSARVAGDVRQGAARAKEKAQEQIRKQKR